MKEQDSPSGDRSGGVLQSTNLHDYILFNFISRVYLIMISKNVSRLEALSKILSNMILVLLSFLLCVKY